jgi:hypothetical protein
LGEGGEYLQAKIQSGLKTVFAEWNWLEAMFNIIHLKFNNTASSEHTYQEAIQKTMLDMQESIRQADLIIQLMHVAIGYDFEASKEETILVWEAIAGVEKGLTRVTADAAADAEFLAQTRNNLPALRINLEKLLNHYKINMPKISTGLASFKVRLEKLERKPPGGSDLFGDLKHLDLDTTTSSSGEAVQLKDNLEQSITEV